jgi:uncharacterized protein YgbK (DUF1537 family)
VLEIGDDDLVARLSRAIRSDGWAVLSTKAGVSDPEGTADCIAEITVAVMNDCACGSLAIFGGDTAAHILARLNVRAIYPIRELLPGVPISRFAAGGRDLTLITKAGGFGDVDLVSLLRSALSGSE